MTTILVIILLALVLDRWLPERGGFRLWVWYSDWAESIEQRFNGGLRSHGTFAVLLAIAPILIVIFLATFVLGQIAGALTLNGPRMRLTASTTCAGPYSQPSRSAANP